VFLHADVDAFFAAVEQRDRPELRGLPVAVGTGVVMAASYEARAYGVRGAMGGTRARALCPDLVAVSPRFDAYVEASKVVFGAFRAEAADVRGMSMEEAFIRPDPPLTPAEAADPVGAARDLGARIRARVARESGLTVTVGGGSTRLAAKMAGRTVKPDGLHVLAPEEELGFLHALPVQDVWGIGAATAAKLHDHGLRHLGDLADFDAAALMAICGKASGRSLHAMVHNREPPVRRRAGRRSVGAQKAIRRTGWSAELDDHLAHLTERIVRRLERSGHQGRTVVLRLRFGDFTRATRSRSLPQPAADERAILATARALLAESRPEVERRALTLVGLTVTGLGAPHMGRQLTLEVGG
jgi:DNA polymerase IV